MLREQGDLRTGRICQLAQALLTYIRRTKLRLPIRSSTSIREPDRFVTR